MGVFSVFFFLTGMISCDYEQNQRLKVTTKYANQRLEIFDRKVGSISYISPVSEGCVEGPSLWVEQVLDVTETGNFKNLRLLLNNLSA